MASVRTSREGLIDTAMSKGTPNTTPGEKDALIVGAGIVGICCALALQDQGFTVRLIDRDTPATGASAGNAGVISPWSCVPQSMPGLWRHVPKWVLDPEGPVTLRWAHLPRVLPWVAKFLRAGQAHRLPAIADAMFALNYPSLDLYKSLLQGTGGENLVHDGYYIHLYRRAEDARLTDLAWRMRLERGATIERLTGDEVREIEPAVAPGYGAAILIKQQGRASDPGAIGRILAGEVEKRGGTFLRGEVRALHPDGQGGAVVHSDLGQMTAAKIVIAAGAWSARLLTPLGLKVPLEAERGYHLVCANPGVELNNVLSEADNKFAVSPMDMGIRFAGTAEFAGLDAPPDYTRAEVLKRQAKRVLPGINTEETTVWMGQRPSTPDSLPCLGPLPGLPKVLAAFGHAHLGLTGAPMTGRIVAGLAAGVPSNIDLAPYRIERFL